MVGDASGQRIDFGLPEAAKAQEGIERQLGIHLNGSLGRNDCHLGMLWTKFASESD